MDGAHHVVAVDDGVGDIAVVCVISFGDHERGDVADCRVGDAPLARPRSPCVSSRGLCDACLGICGVR